MAEKWSDRLLRTRAQVQTLIAGSGLNYPGFFQISNAVGATKQILVWSKSASTINQMALNLTDDTIGIYDITADTFTESVLLASNNLSDVADAETSRTNLGLPSGTWTPTFTAQADPLNALVAVEPFMYSYVGNICNYSGAANLVLQGGATQEDFHYDTPFLRTTNFTTPYQGIGHVQTITFTDVTGAKISAELASKVLNAFIETLSPDASLVLFIEGSFQAD